MIGARSYRSIANILKAGLDLAPLAAEPDAPLLAQSHENVRGSAYYCARNDETDELVN